MSWQSLHQAQQDINPKGLVALLTSSTTRLLTSSTTRLLFHIFTFIFCGRRGTFYIDLHFVWQVWHFCTSTVLLRGRCGTLWHGWNESNSHSRMFFVLVSLWNAFFFQSLAPVSKSDVCVYVGVSMRCVILCSEVIQNGCVLKWCLRVCSEVILLPFLLGGTPKKNQRYMSPFHQFSPRPRLHL